MCFKKRRYFSQSAKKRKGERQKKNKSKESILQREREEENGVRKGAEGKHKEERGEKRRKRGRECRREEVKGSENKREGRTIFFDDRINSMEGVKEDGGIGRGEKGDKRKKGIFRDDKLDIFQIIDANRMQNFCRKLFDGGAGAAQIFNHYFHASCLPEFLLCFRF